MKTASSPSKVTASITLNSNTSGVSKVKSALSSTPLGWSACLNSASGLHLSSQLVGQDEVKPGEVQGPSYLVVVQLVGLLEIRQVLMIHVDLNLELLIRVFKEMPPLL